MAKEKCTSKLQSVTTELFNNYYEDASVTKRKIANNASSKVKGNSVSKQKAVLSSKPQKKVNNLKNQNGNKIIITNSLKQTASFLNNHQRYLQEFPTLGQSYKSQTVPKPQQQQLNKQSSKISNKSFAPKTYKSPATYTAKQTEELLRQFYALCQSYNAVTYFGNESYQTNTWSKNSNGQWISSSSAIALRNAPVVSRNKIQQSYSRQTSTKKQSIQQQMRQQPIRQINKQSEVNLNNEFSDICQCYDGMNYFGKSVYQNNTWSKNRSGNWVSSSTSFSVKNAPVVVRSSKMQQSSRKASSSRNQPVQQIRQQPVRQMNRQQYTVNLNSEFSDICQCYDGMNYFGKSVYQNNTWSKNRSGNWVSSSTSFSVKNAPVVVRSSKIQQSSRKVSSSRNQPVRQMSRQQYTVNLNSEFSDICQCYDGMNYFGKSVYQNNTWSKNRSGNWVSSSTSFSVKNAPVVVRSSKIQQSSRKVSSSRNQPVRQMSRQQYIVNFNSEFSDLCQCYDGMNYFGKSSFQKNTWTINRSGKWVSSSTSFSMKNAPVVIRSSKQQQITRQASVKKQTTQQSRKLKKQQRSMPVVNSAITKEQQQMNQKSIVAQQNASLKLQSKVLKQFKEKQEQLEKKKKLEEQQKEMKQEQMRIQQKKNAERKLKEQQAAKQSIKKNVKQAQSIKKQQLQKNKIRNQKINAPVRKMTKGQEKKMRKRQHLINLVNKRIQELVAEKQQKQLFSQMVKQKAQQILEEKHEASIQKSMQNYKKTQSNKLLEKETYEKQQKSVQKKLAKQKMQIRNKINNKSSSLETQKSKQLKELKSKLTPEQFSKIQSILQQNNNNSKEQNARQLQSEQDKKNWQEQVRKMKERQQEIQQKQRRQSLIKKRFESIKRKLTPKQQINLMNNLKLKQQQKENKSNNSKVNNKKQQVVQKPTKKQTIMKQQKVNMNKNQVWTFVNNNKTQQKPIQKSKGTKQWKTVSSRPLNPSETMMFNKEFAELCNAFESTNYVTYSNYKTWSMNKSGKYVSNASIISARNAPRNTKGGLSKQLNFSGKSSVSMAQKNKPQQVRNIKNNKSRY